LTESEDVLNTEKKEARKLYWLSAGLIVLILALDQGAKFWVKLNMILNTRMQVAGDWFFIHFTENPGMAFGLEFGGEYGKLMLTSFRIVAVLGLIWYLRSQIIAGSRRGFIICLAMITAGAAGNIIDSIFYGKLFTDSVHHVAEFMPEEGYASYFHGKVVDMIYLPIIETRLPEWLGGSHFTFFRPIFNLADTSISLGVIFILLFQRRYFPKTESPKIQDENPTTMETEDSEISTLNPTDDSDYDAEKKAPDA